MGNIERKYARKAATSYPFVQSVEDSTGKVRHYFRREGFARTPLPGQPGSPEFLAAYRTILPVKFRPRKQAGRVYFFQMGEFIKIGFSTQWERRLRQVGAASPLPTVALLTIPGSLKTELELHRQFSAYRTQGEWFKSSAELLTYIDEERMKLEAKGFYKNDQKS